MQVADRTVAYEGADRIERALGCPFDPASTMSFASAVEADEAEQVPSAAFEALRELGVWDHFVPVELGGKLGPFEELLHVVRALSRRDLVVPIGVGSTFLASLPVWIWGSDEQREIVAGHMRSAEFGSLCVSEDDAGSDLVATTTRATSTGAGYTLDGEKWMVGNASRASFMVVLARAESGLGLFLLDTPYARGDSVRALPKIRTLGLRGHDLGGMTFERCAVGPEAPVGRVGRGVEMAAGALQYTRTLIGALAIGAGDTGLRVAVRWARQRQLYGAPIVELPPIRRLLAGAFADLLAAECVATAAARGLNVALPRMALWAPATKYTVPWLCDHVMRACAEVLSARYYLRERVADGIFQKMVRDVSIASIFEGTQLVQLETIRAQLLHGARPRKAAPDAICDADELFDFGAPAEAFELGRKPAISYGGYDEICDGLDQAVEKLLDVERPERAALESQARRLLALRDEVRSDAESMAQAQPGRSSEGYELARRYCLVHAGACCVHAWAAKGDDSGSAWLVVALERLLERLGERCVPELSEFEDRCVAGLVELEEQSRLLSIVPSVLPSEGAT